MATKIQTFSSSVEKYFMSERSKRVKYFSTREEKFRNFKRPYSSNAEQRCDLLCNHSNGDLFTCEDVMFSCESSHGISLAVI